MNITEIVAQVSTAIENAKWNEVKHPNLTAYESVSGAWRLLVAEMNGHADGTATSKSTVVRMTPKQAKDAISKARPSGSPGAL